MIDSYGIYNFYLPEKKEWRTLLLLSSLVEDLEHDNTIISTTNGKISYYVFGADISLDEKENILDELNIRTQRANSGVNAKAV